jgi:DNA repair exonuclease SbcCD nuclease subunit
VNYLVTGDWHLRKDRPICRTDEHWIATQKEKIKQVIEIADKHDCKIVHTGDLFHRARTIPEIELLVQDVEMSLLMGGNHDFEYHNYKGTGKNSVEVVSNFRNIKRWKDTDSIISVHTLVFPDNESRPNIKGKDIGITAEELLEKYPDITWIFTGDYHRNFHYEKEGRHVINPGCLFRQNADFIDYEPGVYLVDTLEPKVIFKKLKIKDSVITDQHLSETEERNDRIDAFIETIKSKKGVTLDFIENLKNKLPEIPNNEKDVLLEIIEEST